MKKYTKKQILEAIAYWKSELKKLNEAIGPAPIDLFMQKTRQVLDKTKDPNQIMVLNAYRKWALASVEFDAKERRLFANIIPANSDNDGLTLSDFIDMAKETGMRKMSDAGNIVGVVSSPSIPKHTYELVDVITDGIGKIFLDFGMASSPEELKTQFSHQAANDFMSEADKQEATEFFA